MSFYVGDDPYQKTPRDMIPHQCSEYARASSTKYRVLNHCAANEDLLGKMSNYDHKKVHWKLSQKRLHNTTQWFLEHPSFKELFIEKKYSSLWCSGKSMYSISSLCVPPMLMCAFVLPSWVWQNNDSVSQTNYSSSYNSLTMNRTAIIDAAKSRFSNLKSPVVFFYCNHEYNDELSASFVVSSFIKQICEFQYQHCGHFPEDVAPDLRRFFGPERTLPDFDDLESIFSRLCRVVPDTVYIIDGIDALQESHAIRLLKFVQQLFSSPDISQKSRVLLLSRDQVPGYINVGTFIHGICQIPISTNALQDIEIFIETSITEKMMYRKLTEDDSLLKRVKETLLSESSNMYEAKLAEYRGD